MSCRIIGTTNEVVEGNIVEVGKGDENIKGGLSSTIFVVLKSNFTDTDSICHLLLSKTTFEANLFELSIKRIHWVNLQSQCRAGSSERPMR